MSFTTGKDSVFCSKVIISFHHSAICRLNLKITHLIFFKQVVKVFFYRRVTINIRSVSSFHSDCLLRLRENLVTFVTRSRSSCIVHGSSITKPKQLLQSTPFTTWMLSAWPVYVYISLKLTEPAHYMKIKNRNQPKERIARPFAAGVVLRDRSQLAFGSTRWATCPVSPSHFAPK